MAYNQKVQDILSDYGTGALTAAKAKKALKEQGYGADFREAPTGEIFVYEINLGPDEEGEGDFYNFAEGGDVKRPTPTYKSMDMSGDILDSYLAGLGNSKDTTIKGGGSKKKPKPIKKAKGGLVSPRKAQGMYRG